MTVRYTDMFEFQVREQPGAEFAVSDQEAFTYAEAEARANQIAHALVAAGYRVGDRIGLLAKNSIDFILFYLGASKVGVVPTPLNYRLAPREWALILNDSGAKGIVADDDFVDQVGSVRADLTSATDFVVRGEGGSDWRTFDEWIGSEPTVAVDIVVPGSTPLYQVYTSGTTGRPKGVLMPHESMAWQTVQQSFALTRAEVLSGRLLVTAPLFHAGIASLWMTAAAFGGSVFVQEQFEPHATVSALQDERIAWTLLIPSMLQSCLVNVATVADSDYTDLDLIVYGGSPIAESTLRRAIEVFRCGFLQLYGLTETNTVVQFQPSDHRAALESNPERLLSAGRPVAGSAVKVVDPDGDPVAVGEVGEILVRGPQLFAGYWNNPAATEEGIDEGWLHTGDAGSLDEDGYLYVQDRIKDMIVTGGENVYPREVEDVLFEHPAVADVAVIGVPHDTWGEAVKAVVVLREGAAATEDELIDFCRDKIGGFKRPRSVDFIAEMPRNPSGKVLKKELREPYWAGHTRRVG